MYGYSAPKTAVAAVLFSVSRNVPAVAATVVTFCITKPLCVTRDKRKNPLGKYPAAVEHLKILLLRFVTADRAT